MPPFLQVFIFIFGAIIGSFLNAVLWRLRTRESFIYGRSYCPKCRHPLSVCDLVPLLSYLFLRGKCRYCSLAISPSYFLIEALTGILFVLTALSAFPAGAESIGADAMAGLLLGWFAVAIAILVFFYDLRYMLIPRSVTLPAAALAFAANAFLGFDIRMLVIGTAIGGGFFWLQRVISKGRWVGGGDVYLGLFMGALLGYPLILAALFFAYVAGASIGLALMYAGKKTMKSEIPFGTFLAASAVFTMLYGQTILEWYLGML